jgi:hypothetical protein
VLKDKKSYMPEFSQQPMVISEMYSSHPVQLEAQMLFIEIKLVMHAGILIHMIPPSYICSSPWSRSILYDAATTAIALQKRD